MNAKIGRSLGRDSGSIVGRIAFAIFALLLSGVALYFALYWVPLYVNGIIRTQTYEIEQISTTRYSGKMFDALRSYFAPHAEELISLEKRAFERPLTREDLENALALPSVQEAFWVDFERGVGFVVGDVFPIESIFTDTTLSHSQERVALPDTLKPWRSLRFADRNKNGVDYTVAFRPIRHQVKGISHEMVGVVLLTEPITQQGTKKLTRQFADPLEAELEGQNSNGKHGSFGVIRGSDTLWWWGDRNVTVATLYDERSNLSNTAWHHAGWVIPVSGLNVSIVTKAAEPAWTGTVEKFSKMLAKFSRAIVVMGLVFLYLLVFSLVLANRQSRRNQIALGHLAHSVKTPVARLQLAADILEGGQVSTPEEERKIIHVVSEECRQLRRAVENAALAMEGGKIAIHKEPGDLADLVAKTAEAWRQSFDHAGVALVTIGTDLSLPMLFDHDKMRLALDNLIDNALRYTYLNLNNLGADAAVVTITLRSEGKQVLLSVTDSGAGIPEADMKHVFQRFGRSSKDPLTGVSGLGLGLALVKEIIEGHGGKVKVENVAGGGAKIEIQTIGV